VNYAAPGHRAAGLSLVDPATSTIIDDSYVVYCGSSCNSTQNVGSKSPKGDGSGANRPGRERVGVTLDWYESPYPMPCSNCADLTGASLRAARGGGFNGLATYFLRSAFRNNSAPGSHDYVVGSVALGLARLAVHPVAVMLVCQTPLLRSGTLLSMALGVRQAPAAPQASVAQPPRDEHRRWHRNGRNWKRRRCADAAIAR